MRGTGSNAINPQVSRAQRAEERRTADENQKRRLRERALDMVISALPYLQGETRVTEVAKTFYEFLCGKERKQRVKRRKRRAKKAAKK